MRHERRMRLALDFCVLRRAAAVRGERVSLEGDRAVAPCRSQDRTHPGSGKANAHKRFFKNARRVHCGREAKHIGAAWKAGASRLAGIGGGLQLGSGKSRLEGMRGAGKHGPPAACTARSWRRSCAPVCLFWRSHGKRERCFWRLTYVADATAQPCSGPRLVRVRDNTPAHRDRAPSGARCLAPSSAGSSP